MDSSRHVHFSRALRVHGQETKVYGGDPERVVGRPIKVYGNGEHLRTADQGEIAMMEGAVDCSVENSCGEENRGIVLYNSGGTFCLMYTIFL